MPDFLSPKPYGDQKQPLNPSSNSPAPAHIESSAVEKRPEADVRVRMGRNRFLRQKGGPDQPADADHHLAGSDQIGGPDSAIPKVPPAKKRSKLLVQYYASTFLLLITLFLVTGYVLLKPMIDELKRTNETVEVRLLEVEQGNAFLNSVDASIAIAKDIPEDVLLRVDEALPKREDIPKLLKMFAQIGLSNDVEISSISFGATGNAIGESISGFSLAPVEISLSVKSPGYLAMREFLHDIETNIRLMEVQSISVNTDEAEGSFSYTLQLQSYILQKASPASVPAPAGPSGSIDEDI